ncbi:MAG: beta strand repeat-containing protein [Limisphaerales bacterium]
MKKIINLRLLFALLVAVAPLGALADTFFTDDFSAGSAINSSTPTSPTANSTSYETISSKSWSPTPSITSGDLQFGIASTSGGTIEIQALFATNAVALTAAGDYIQMTITFTNTTGLLTAKGFLGFGLYNSGQVQPIAGGLDGTAVSGDTTAVTGGVQNWQGYVGQIGFTGQKSQIMTRAAQTGSGNNNQDLVTSGSSSESYGNPSASTVGSSSTTPSVTLTAGATYTEVLTITLTDVNTLAITNSLYVGSDTNGTLVTQFGGVASGSTYLTSGFDGFAVGWYEKGSEATTMDISSVAISGQVTVISTPPTITSEPVPVAVPNGGSGAFSVVANGFSVTYQWHRNGTNLIDGDNIFGSTSDTLIISPAGLADAASGANGYYVTVSGAGGYSTNSTTNSLTLVTATNLVWSGSGSVWDLNNSANWLDPDGNSTVFNYGDPVTFDDTGAANTFVTLTGNYLSAAAVTVDSTYSYSFNGSGSFAGPGSLIYKGSGFLTINNANTYSGGTIISNANAYLLLNNYNGLGAGPITLAKAGGQMEITPNANASLGINGDIVVSDDFTITYDSTNGSYGALFFGQLRGAKGKTLTINHTTGPSPSRVRFYGDNTVYDGNLNLEDSSIVWATYQSSGSQTYNGVISGSGAVMQKGTTTYLNGDNTYSGGTMLATGGIGLGIDSTGNPVTSGPIGTGPLLLTVDSTTSKTGHGMVFASGGDRTIANPIQNPAGTNNLTLIVGGTNNLTLSGSFTLNGNDGSASPAARTIQVTNTGLTTISGIISDNGSGIGLTKTGDGTLALNGANTYTGSTTISNGMLEGTGAIASPVTVENGATLGAGTASIGTLTINNNLTLDGNLLVKVNKSLSPSNDVVTVSGTLANTGTGTVTVTNLGSALAAGDKFYLFNKAVQNGSALTISGDNVVWANNLETDGSISVSSLVIPKPVINSVVLQSGTQLVLSGTNGAGGGGYSVLSSTNIATPLTNWTVEASGTFDGSGGFSFTNNITPGTPQKFLLLRVP